MTLPLPPVMEHYNTVLALKRGEYAVSVHDLQNDRTFSQVKTIPAGTIMKVDFVSDDMFYAFAAISGVMRKVAIKLEDFGAIIPVKG